MDSRSRSGTGAVLDSVTPVAPQWRPCDPLPSKECRCRSRPLRDSKIVCPRSISPLLKRLEPPLTLNQAKDSSSFAVSGSALSECYRSQRCISERATSPHTALYSLVLVLSVVPLLAPLRPDESSCHADSLGYRPLREALKAEAGEDVHDGNQQELQLEAVGQIDDVEDERQRVGGAEKHVGAEASQSNKANHQRSCASEYARKDSREMEGHTICINRFAIRRAHAEDARNQNVLEARHQEK